MIKTSVFIATSLDGCIARADDSLDWLEQANARIPAGEDCGFAEFLAGVDVLIMGRASFDKVLSFGAEAWPYGPRRVLVLTRRPLDVPAHLQERVEASAEQPRTLLARLATEGFVHAYVDGGLTVQRFLADGLIDALTVTLIPVLLGAGKRLFGALPADQWLQAGPVKTWPFGFVQLSYQRSV